MHPKPIRVFLCEDSEVTRLGICTMLSRASLELVGQAGSGEECLERLLTVTPDVLLMDVEMPGMSGIECTLRAKSSFPDVRVLMLTSSVDARTVVEAMAAGADGYCLKNVGLNSLITAVEAVSQGAVWLDASIAQFAIQKSVSTSVKRHKPASSVLSAREQEVLELLTQGHTNTSIARKLYLSADTVKTHVRNIMNKLDVQDRTAAAVKATRMGLVSIEEPVHPRVRALA